MRKKRSRKKIKVDLHFVNGDYFIRSQKGSVVPVKKSMVSNEYLFEQSATAS